MRKIIMTVMVCCPFLNACAAGTQRDPELKNRTPESLSHMGASGSATQPRNPPLGACHGERRALTVSRQMPYHLVGVGGTEAHFVLDFGSNGSYIDVVDGFPAGAAPRPTSVDTYPNFNFFGAWGPVFLKPQSYKHISGTVRQAGKIGTDFLSLHVFTLDYSGNAIYRAQAGSFCTDAELRAEGFIPTTAGIYSNKPGMGKNDPPNIPSVPVRIGSVTAVGQVDTGFDDTDHRHSVNINRPYFDALQAAGVRLVPLGREEPSLTTCVRGVFDKITGYRLAGGASFEVLGSDGSVIVSAPDAVVFLKETPEAAKSCLGIGSLPHPAAQIGASFYIDAGRMVFDPFTSRVWFGRAEPPARNVAPGT